MPEPDGVNAPGEGGGAEAPTGSQRLGQALRRPGSRSQVVVGALLGLLGFAAVVQVQANNEDDRYVGASQQDLIQLINSLQLATDRTERQISSLEATRRALLSDTEARETAFELARRQAAALGILTGTTPAVGTGVRITLDGPPNSIGTAQLVNGIQELRVAGAEAIQINKQVRVVGSSAISDGPGDTIVVDGQQLEPPYVLDVIGNPTALREGVYFPEGFAFDVERTGGVITFRELERVEVTAIRELDPPDFATPTN